jgi:MFS family permease
MSDARYSEGEFRVGHVLSRTFTVLSRNLLPFCVVTAIAYLPSLWLLAERGQRITSAGHIALLILLGVLVSIVLNALSEAIVLFGAFEDMRGRPVNLMASAQVGLSRLFPVLGVALLVGLFTGIAALLFLIPAFIVLTMLFAAMPACIVERLGPMQSLRRSRELTKGHRWAIFGLWFLVAIVVAIGSSLAGAIGSLIGGSVLSLLFNLIWGALAGAFNAIMVVVAYHDLRVAKEGVDTDKIASVFD